MSGNRFVLRENDIEEFLSHLICERDVFQPGVEIEFWKSAHESLEAVLKLVDIQEEHWKSMENFKAIGKKVLKSVRKTTTNIMKKLEKQGQEGKHWCGASPECQEILTEYRTEIYKEINPLLENIQEDTNFRQDFEARFFKAC